MLICFGKWAGKNSQIKIMKKLLLLLLVLPVLALELSIRVFGVDTPEKGHRAQCASEAQRGEAASAFTKQLIAASQKRQIVLMDWDKYGGRVLGDVLLNGVSLRQQLIANGFAREYYGEAKTSWCQ
jgi:endonuclease YncB( thermonuclease family)